MGKMQKNENLGLTGATKRNERHFFFFVLCVFLCVCVGVEIGRTAVELRQAAGGRRQSNIQSLRKKERNKQPKT